MKPGDDVVVDFDGAEFPGEVVKPEHSGYLICRIHTDPLYDYGRGGSRIMPVQTVAVRASRVRPREVNG